MTKQIFCLDGWEAWEDADPEEARTFGRLSICPDATAPATRVHDKAAQSTRDFIYASAYPLAEWLASNYWFLIALQGRRRSLNLVEGGGGYLLPDLQWRSLGSLVELKWSARELPDQPVDFIGSGRTMLPIRNAEKEISKFIEKVLARLGPLANDSALTQEWNSITTSLRNPDESRWCMIAASLGLHPYALSDADREQLAAAYDALPNIDLITQLAPACETTVELAEKAALSADRLAPILGTQAPGLAAIKEETSAGRSTQPAYERGFELAREVRRLGQAPDVFGDYGAVKKWALEIAEDNEWLIESDYDSVVQGVLNSGKSTQIGMNLSKFSDHKRSSFLLARGLGQYFASKGSSRVILAPNDTVESRIGRAFAAELLAPAEVIKERMPSRRIDVSDVERLSEQFGVELMVVAHQIGNHHLGEVVS